MYHSGKSIVSPGPAIRSTYSGVGGKERTVDFYEHCFGQIGADPVLGVEPVELSVGALDDNAEDDAIILGNERCERPDMNVPSVKPSHAKPFGLEIGLLQHVEIDEGAVEEN